MCYRRVISPEGTYFFTVNLQNRKSKLLIEYIDKLRTAFRHAKAHHPFTINAIVVLPDHVRRSARPTLALFVKKFKHLFFHA